MKRHDNFVSLLSKLFLLVASFSNLLLQTNAQFQGESLKFKLSAMNLPNADLDGPSDPYVMLFTAIRRSSDRHAHWQYLGTTATKVNTLNPVWDEVFQYQYINGTDQSWRFFVKDQDESWINPIYAIDDPLGRVDIRVEDYIFQLRKSKQERGNSTGPLKPIQMFLTHPLGGVLHVNPVTDDNE